MAAYRGVLFHCAAEQNVCLLAPSCRRYEKTYDRSSSLRTKVVTKVENQNYLRSLGFTVSQPTRSKAQI